MLHLLQMACRSLFRQKRRSILIAAGIAVGSASVVLVTAMGTAGRGLIDGELDQLGINSIVISAADSSHSLALPQLEQLRQESVVAAAAPVSVQMTSVAMAGQEGSMVVWGVDDQAQEVVSMTLLYGRMLNQVDIRSQNPVCVVDRQTAQKFYQRDNIVGKTLRVTVGGVPLELEVVGVVATGGALLQEVMGELPGFLYLPYPFLVSGEESQFQKILVRLKEPVELEAGLDLATCLGQRQGDRSAYQAENLSQQKETLDSIMTIITWILGAIAAVSLLVSGLGIATVMLMTVGERTREIGVKKALGAPSSSILIEFLSEAVLLSCLGSVIGVLIGTAAVAAGSILFTGTPFSFSVPWGILVGVPIASAVLGGIFGAYPAQKAANYSPMEALRRGE